MPATLSEKILSRAAGRQAAVGDIVTCRVDLAMMHDSSGPRRVGSRLQELGVPVWDSGKVVLVTDHFVPATNARGAEILATTRSWVVEQGIESFHDMQGICHVLLAERRHLRPGMFAVGGDSHSPTAGAFGTFMVGIGATEMTGVLASGEIWVRVPATVRIDLHNSLPKGVMAKDIMLQLCASIGMDNDYRVMEFAGAGVAEMICTERMVLTNMCAELGAKTGIIAPDSKTLEFLGLEAEPELIADWQSDADASFERCVDIDLSSLEPQAAAPHSPANAAAVGDSLGTHIDQAYIGACTGAKISDLHAAAEVLRGREVAAGVRLLVAPASRWTLQEAMEDGTAQALSEAGATFLPSGCGACAGMGAGLLAAKEVAISSTARNFKGRMGAPDSEVWLGSPATVAASAIAGAIADPREFLD